MIDRIDIMIIKKLKELYRHSCMNCKYLEMYHNGCLGEMLLVNYDCVNDNELQDGRHFYLSPKRENDCEFFEQDEIGRNQDFIRKWRADCGR